MVTNKIQLRKLISYLVAEVLPAAINRKSFIINDISDETYLDADEELAGVVLSNLINNTVSSSHNSCIRISVVQEDDHTTISVSDNSNDYSRFISGKMNKVQPIVKKMGGDLNFEFNKRNSITIQVSFMHNKMAA